MPKINIPLYHRLYEDIKEKILHNEYKKNSKLESIRSLSSRLDIEDERFKLCTFKRNDVQNLTCDRCSTDSTVIVPVKALLPR